MTEVSVSLMAVLAGVVISMVLGFAWYSPMLFGNLWMKELGKKKDELGSPNTGYFAMVVASALMTYIMAHFVSYAGADTASEGLVAGLWLWLGFVATTGVGKTVFQGQSVKLYLIDYGYNLVQFALIGMLLAVWR